MLTTSEHRAAASNHAQPGDVRSRRSTRAPRRVRRRGRHGRVIVPGLTRGNLNFFAYFPANSSYPAILGDLLTAGLSAGHELGHRPGVHRSRDADGRLDARTAGPAGALPVDEQHRGWRDPRIGQRGHTRIDPRRTLAHHRGHGQHGRRCISTRCICNISGAQQHREGLAHRRDRHRSSARRSTRRHVCDATRRACGDDRRRSRRRPRPVLGVLGARHDQLDGVRSDHRDRFGDQARGLVAARRWGR